MWRKTNGNREIYRWTDDPEVDQRGVGRVG